MLDAFRLRSRCVSRIARGDDVQVYRNLLALLPYAVSRDQPAIPQPRTPLAVEYRRPSARKPPERPT